VSIAPGQTLGQYRIVEQLGRGGMATVYKAFQPSLSRQVAIKVLPEFFVEDPSFHERFRQEGTAIATLRHPNILAVFDSGEADGVAYIVTELVDGGTLADQLGKPLPADYCLGILRSVGSALDYAHARGLVHRDVKPSNILLARDGTPVLSDFGLARMMASPDQSTARRLTVTGTAVGTPEYMAPEQASEGEAGPAADLYSLAVVLYEMLTGSVPYTAETPLAVLLAHANKPLPLPRERNPKLSEAVQDVLLKGLAKEPADRYRTAAEMVRAFEMASRTPETATASSSETTPTPIADKPPTPAPAAAAVHLPKRPIVLASVVVAALLVATLTFVATRPVVRPALVRASETPATLQTPPPAAVPAAKPGVPSSVAPSGEPSSVASSVPTPAGAGSPTSAAVAPSSAVAGAKETIDSALLPPRGKLLYVLGANTSDFTKAPLQNSQDKIAANGSAFDFTAASDGGPVVTLPVNGIGDFVAGLKIMAVSGRASVRLRFHGHINQPITSCSSRPGAGWLRLPRAHARLASTHAVMTSMCIRRRVQIVLRRFSRVLSHSLFQPRQMKS